MAEILSTQTVLDLPPNGSKKRPILNPGSWSQEKREGTARHTGRNETMINPHQTLAALEHAIQALDLVLIGQRIEPDELATTLRELRMARVEHLKEIG